MTWGQDETVVASDDGSRVFFGTRESLVSTDSDSCPDTSGGFEPGPGCWDFYERSGGQTTLVSTGPSGANTNNDVIPRAISPDGSRVYLQTAAPLSPADTDSCDNSPNFQDPGCDDVYLRTRRSDHVRLDQPRSPTASTRSLISPARHLTARACSSRPMEPSPATTTTRVPAHRRTGAGTSTSALPARLPSRRRCGPASTGTLSPASRRMDPRSSSRPSDRLLELRQRRGQRLCDAGHLQRHAHDGPCAAQGGHAYVRIARDRLPAMYSARSCTPRPAVPWPPVPRRRRPPRT